MNKRSLLIIAVVGIASMFLATAIYAGTTVADVVNMENKAYKKHKKSIVKFSHKKHNVEYKAGCGEHAEALHLNCISCHKKANKASGTKAAPTSCAKCHPKKK